MLVLAGVSLNAIIGDNGIITNAQDAKMKSGMAALEEWLQQKYVEYYDETEKYINKPELLADKISNLFLKQGVSNYVTSGLSGNGIQQYYLLNKSILPKEIREGLVGGDTTDYASYIGFIDVYGITEDLKVYYCKEGLVEGVVGNAKGLEVKSDTTLQKIKSDSQVSTAIKEQLGLAEDQDVTVGDIQRLVELTLTGVSNLNALSECYYLKKLTIKDSLGMENLVGLESCATLENLYFSNTTVGDYAALGSLLKLKQLSIYSPSTILEEDANLNIKNLCNGLKNASKLMKISEFVISGENRIASDALAGSNNLRSGKFNQGSDSYVGDSAYNVGTEISNITKLSYLENIHSNIKNSINYLYLHNNKIGGETDVNDNSGLFYLRGFNNVITLGVMNNRYLTNLNGLSDMGTLRYLYAYNCYHSELDDKGQTKYVGLNDVSSVNNCSTLLKLYIDNNLALQNLNTLTGLTSLKNLYAFSCNISDITGINGLTQLNYLSLYSNLGLINVSTLGSLTGLRTLYLENNTAMDGNQLKVALQDTGILAQCGTNYSIPTSILDEYFTMILAEYSFEGKDSSYITSMLTLFRTSDLSRIVKMDFTGCSSISNDDLQAVICRMKNVELLCLNGCSNLTSIDFVKGEYKDASGKDVKNPLSNLYELDIRGTASTLTDLSFLNTKCTKIRSLVVDNPNINFAGIAKTINEYLYANASKNTNKTFYDGLYSWNGFGGLVLCGAGSSYVLNGAEGGNFYGITNLSIRSNYSTSSSGNGIVQSGTLDLSNTKLTNLTIFQSGYNFSLPKGLTSFSAWAHTSGVTFAAGTELGFCHLNQIKSSPSLLILKQLNTLPTELYIRRLGPTDFSYLKDVDENGEYVYDCSGLVTLTVGNPSEGGQGSITSFDGIERAINLKTLNVQAANVLSNIDDICKLSNLESLSFSYTRAENFTIVLAKGTNKLSKLKTLSISGSKNIKSITGLDQISSLTSVTINGTQISNITGLSNQTELTSLDLKDNNITDLSELDTLITNKAGNLGFSKLNLYKNNIVLFSGSHENAETILNLLSHGVTSITLYSGDGVAESTKLSGISGITIQD